MSESLNPMTFDLAGVLANRDYPTLDIKAHFDEATGFAIDQAHDKIREAELMGDTEATKALYKAVEEFTKKVQDQAYTITLKSIPERVRRNLLKSVKSEFPDEINALTGIPEQNIEADEAYLKKVWAAYCQVITPPGGVPTVLSEEDIRVIYDQAPSHVYDSISEGIKKLQTGSKRGFEIAARDVDFLSLASPEG